MIKNFTRFTLTVFFAVSLFLQSSAISLKPSSTEPSAQPDSSKIVLKNALDQFNSLPTQERKAKIKDAKALFKSYKKAKKEGKSDDETNTILLCILAILLPPLAVYLKERELNGRFWLSVLLTLLFWLPGVIYALLIVLDEV